MNYKIKILFYIAMITGYVHIITYSLYNFSSERVVIPPFKLTSHLF